MNPFLPMEYSGSAMPSSEILLIALNSHESGFWSHFWPDNLQDLQSFSHTETGTQSGSVANNIGVSFLGSDSGPLRRVLHVLWIIPIGYSSGYRRSGSFAEN
jgi:hypothetical protein